MTWAGRQKKSLPAWPSKSKVQGPAESPARGVQDHGLSIPDVPAGVSIPAGASAAASGSSAGRWPWAESSVVNRSAGRAK
jgi:hypothetical protein